MATGCPTALIIVDAPQEYVLAEVQRAGDITG
jgi:hypothetical protein